MRPWLTSVRASSAGVRTTADGTGPARASVMKTSDGAR